MKILGIGLSKTGTTSLNRALEILGYNAGHFVLPKVFDSLDAITDVTASARYQELDQKYAGSKFILTVRNNVDAWLRSCALHFPNSSAARRFDPEWVAEVNFVRRKLYGAFNFDRNLWRAAYFRHLGEVTEYFEGRSDLLLFDVCAGDGWEKLCGFLGRPVPPGTPFPHENVTGKARQTKPS